MKSILVPISFSETSRNALIHANLIAKQHGAKICLLNCYPDHIYNRKYNFGSLDYKKGIEKMLVKFYTETIGDEDEKSVKYLAYAGSVSYALSEISFKFDLLVLSRKTGLQSNPNQTISDKIYYFALESLCPILLMPTGINSFSLSGDKNIWHIKMKDFETDLITQELEKLNIDSKHVNTKSLKQDTISSPFWRNIIGYSQNHNEQYLSKISELFNAEHIDLLIVVNHKQGIFEKFLRDDVYQIVSQFDIPFLIIESKNFNI